MDTRPSSPPPAPSIEILYADDDVVVVNKGPGLVVHRGWAREKVVVMTLARDALGAHVYPVHRLDRQTSGALCFALHPEAARRLRAHFDEGLVDKRYLALVRGALREPGVIDYAIPRSEDGPRVPAVTEFRSLWVSARERAPGSQSSGPRERAPQAYTLVEAHPKTGRLHQIRRHFKHINHPIVWDKKYGRGFFNDLAAREYGVDRMVLHARSLAFAHPMTGAPLVFQAPVRDLSAVFERMGIPPEHWT
jgi:tRNA pseudouridine65 synthase